MEPTKRTPGRPRTGIQPRITFVVRIDTETAQALDAAARRLTAREGRTVSKGQVLDRLREAAANL